MGISRLLNHLLLTFFLLCPGISLAQVEGSETLQMFTALQDASFAEKIKAVNICSACESSTCAREIPGQGKRR